MLNINSISKLEEKVKITFCIQFWNMDTNINVFCLSRLCFPLKSFISTSGIYTQRAVLSFDSEHDIKKYF